MPGHPLTNPRPLRRGEERSRVDRRRFCRVCLGATAAGLVATPWFRPHSFLNSATTPTFSIIPVVGDGKWIWREPPDGQTGQLEPREFDLSVTIRWEGTGVARNLAAATVIPAEFPEQKIIEHSSTTNGCDLQLQKLSSTANQMLIRAGMLARGQTIDATIRMRLQITKSFFNYQRDQFPDSQKHDREIASTYLRSSPGIEIRSRVLKDIVQSIVHDWKHPWNQAAQFFAWSRENIEGKPMAYTSVATALRNRVGDCEERAGVFVALCRTAGIPARLVWVPNHAWAEFCLVDHDGTPHWIPAHTAGYSWFGWTGAHELVLQKGDRILLPQTGRHVRLVSDWWTWQGAEPELTFAAQLTPVGDTIEAAGPGAREKMPTGQWQLSGKHTDDRHMRV